MDLLGCLVYNLLLTLEEGGQRTVKVLLLHYNQLLCRQGTLLLSVALTSQHYYAVVAAGIVGIALSSDTEHGSLHKTVTLLEQVFVYAHLSWILLLRPEVHERDRPVEFVRHLGLHKHL